MSDMESMGKRIKRLRKERGMTQEELAGAVGVSPQAVSKWENDYTCPDISILPTLAKVFGISTDELLGGETAAAQGEFLENPDGNRAGYEHGEKKTNRKSHLQSHFVGVSAEKFWWGIFVILVGAVLILKNVTNIIPWGAWSLIWPLAIICFGMGEVCRRPNPFSISVTLFGVYVLLCNTDVIPPEFSGKWIWLFIGAVLIIGGISALLPKRLKRAGGLKHGNYPPAARELHCENGYINYEGAFCSDRVVFEGGVLHGGNLDTSFGSYIIDLTPLEMVGENAGLDVDVSFASLTLLLPRTVRLTEARDTAFGSVNIKGSANDDAPYSLTVTSDVSFGSLDVKYV